MSRDHRKLKVFQLADELVLQVYRVTSRCRRTSGAPPALPQPWSRALRVERPIDYARFVTIALGSASEVRHLLSVGRRLALAHF